jgi:hypothetical protein
VRERGELRRRHPPAAGYIGLGFTAAPTSIELRLSGPPAAVELCVAGVELRALSAR